MDFADKVALWLTGITSGLFVWNSYRLVSNIHKCKGAHKDLVEFQDAMNNQGQKNISKIKEKVKNKRAPQLVLLKEVPPRLLIIKQKPIYMIRSHPPTQAIFQHVSGLAFEFKQGIIHPDRIRCDINDAKVDKQVLKQTHLPDSPNTTFWYKFLQAFQVRNLNLRYSPTQTVLTLSPITMSIYGSLYFDELNDIFKLDVKFLSKNSNVIYNYFYDQKQNFILDSLLNLFGVVIFGYFAYASLCEFLGKMRLFRERGRGRIGTIKKEYVMADPADRLNCKLCKSRIASVLFDCCHLATCEDCLGEAINQCPQCHEMSSEHVKLFIS